jgi:serine/threonine protein phosphatase PrpC
MKSTVARVYLPIIVALFCFTIIDIKAGKPTNAKRNGIAYGSASLQGQRPYQEDRRLVEKIDNQFTLAAVFDGHRNDIAADFLAKNFPAILRKEFTYELVRNSIPDCPISSVLHDTFLSVNRALYDHLQQLDTKSGSTGAMALINKNMIYIAHVGDSRIVHSNGTALTRDHKFSNPAEKNRIFEINKDRPAILDAIAENGFIYLPSQELDGSGVAMTRAFGDFYLRETGLIADPDVCSRRMNPGEFIIIASDGIWDVLSDKETAEFVKNRIDAAIPLDRIAQELCVYAAFHTWSVEQQESLDFIQSWKTALRHMITSLPMTKMKGLKNELLPEIAFIDPKSGHDNQTALIVLF